jgi:peptidoglycan/xylan/chitin deacetylase (PgdA/CDA1 family)
MYVALNLNLDSLSECLRLVGVDVDHRTFVDPCFFAVMDRFLALARRYNAPLSVYVIGQDLLCPDHRRQVRLWSDLGCEIGNHTWSHPQSLSNLSLEETRREVIRAHDIIAEAADTPPAGFIAPAWSTSPTLVRILTEAGYRYDTSLIPSWVQLLALAKLRAKSRADRPIPVLRKDLSGLLWGCRQPFLATPGRPWRPNERGLPTLPLPTGPARLPIWHTMAFLMPAKTWEWVLRKGLSTNRAFYYVMHPADLLDPDKDLRGLPSALRGIERLDLALAEKMALMQRSLDIIAENAQFVTMQELARRTFEGAGPSQKEDVLPPSVCVDVESIYGPRCAPARAAGPAARAGAFPEI